MSRTIAHSSSGRWASVAVVVSCCVNSVLLWILCLEPSTAVRQGEMSAIKAELIRLRDERPVRPSLEQSDAMAAVHAERPIETPQSETIRADLRNGASQDSTVSEGSGRDRFIAGLHFFVDGVEACQREDLPLLAAEERERCRQAVARMAPLHVGGASAADDATLQPDRVVCRKWQVARASDAEPSKRPEKAGSAMETRQYPRTVC